MGVFSRLSSSLGLKQFPANKAGSKCNAGYATEVQQPSVETDLIATYLLPGSAVVQVSGQAMKKIARLQPGEKILSTDVVKGGTFIWASVEGVEAMPETSKQNTVALGLGEADDEIFVNAEQVILVRDRKKKMAMQTVRRLQVGPDSAVMYNADGLHWRGKKAQEVKKISGLRVSREKECAGGMYKVAVGSTNHALLVSYDPNSASLLVVNSTNSTVDLNGLADCSKGDDGKIKMQVKNTFIEMEVPADEADDEKTKGIPRSYSDSDVHRLALELELDEGRDVEQALTSRDEMDLSSATSRTLSHKTGSSTISSIMAKSAVSSESGGSISQVRVGTQAVVAVDGHQTSKATSKFKLSEYESLPLNEDGVRLPAASSTHTPGRKSKCRKCAFYNTFSFKKGKICMKGALCDFCHEGHDRFIHRR